MKKILIIEDEINVRQPLATLLGREGYQILEASTLKEGNHHLEANPDLILLDWMLPDGHGVDLMKSLRGKGASIPIIMLTAKNELLDKVLGLELGANDYITKPFEIRELLARIAVQLRPIVSGKTGHRENGLVVSDIYLSRDTHEAKYRGNAIVLTKTEFDLLSLFLENPIRVFSREELLKRVWGYQSMPTTRTVDTHILQLRQKTKPELFETVHGIGYRFRPTKNLAMDLPNSDNSKFKGV